MWLKRKRKLLNISFTGTAITDLMDFYRKTFPTESVTPKLHMLEVHVVKFIDRWRIGLGMYGEQGGESIHPEFNQLRKMYTSVPSRKDRLKYMMEQHHMKVRPVAQSMVPVIQKRKFKAAKEE